ncbi:ABSCISIC ACID-INSENSITIVE 5-like protein 2 [Striga hermonthica]|uniref:ABSCISIC ACID-INSENSITIVE 5-like protein 2 n=1 Tax=Striga hermonthica TaxID=68872 RepID=A0A9N7NPX1_STRHE|nr:ABSCISIC ACID-INSENSITIVE 5-like protein 2 [Striga hermonthica]
MESRRSAANTFGGTQARTQIPIHDPKPNPLGRQGSLYNLTFAEMENQMGDLGKPLSSMNLDELLKTLFTGEANDTNQTVEGGDSGLSGQQPGRPTLLSPLNRQPSVTLSHDLSKKTVDEVWHDIQQDHKKYRLDRKVTLGEMTLEDFLVKAGAVSGKKNLGSLTEEVEPTIGLSQQASQWMSYPFPSIHPHQPQPIMMPVFAPGHSVQQTIPIGGNPVMESVAYPENQITLSSSPIMGNLSDTQTSSRKRALPGIVEKSVERRQKRMIKNRESAARSRARKQAYTHELENKVSLLEEENERLKRQQEWEKVLPTIPPPEPKYQLRRTSSAPL